jgi:hypothetical protein
MAQGNSQRCLFSSIGYYFSVKNIIFCFTGGKKFYTPFKMAALKNDKKDHNRIAPIQVSSVQRLL